MPVLFSESSAVNHDRHDSNAYPLHSNSYSTKSLYYRLAVDICISVDNDDIMDINCILHLRSLATYACQGKDIRTCIQFYKRELILQVLWRYK